MKYAIPEISWHNRDPVLSVDFQPKRGQNEPLRLATGGTDSHVLIWYISVSDTGSVNLEVAADLTRHQKAVNVVRWSPDGQFLASGDDESIIFVWKQNPEKEPMPSMENGDEVYKESWTIYKTLRGHMEDVLDISWSANSLHLASGSVDNKLIIWDVTKGKYTTILTDHKGFVQGVAWDPKGQLLASASSDRVFRTFDVNTKKVLSRSSKATLPFPTDHPLQTAVRLYHDDTLQTFYRRLDFSPDGLLIAVPAGRIEAEDSKFKPVNAVYIYTRHSLKVPACVLPCDSPPLVTRWSPQLFVPRPGGPPSAFPVARRMLLAVATKGSVILYDTQQKTPIALVSNIHYTRLTDLTWSPDGRTLVSSSTDGFCSVISFGENELGEVLVETQEEQTVTEPMEVDSSPETTKKEEKPKKSVDKPKKTDEKTKKSDEKPKKSDEKPKKSDDVKKINRLDSFVKFKSPPTKQVDTKMDKTPVKMDVLEEVAMPSWSDNSNNEIIKPKETEIIQIEDSEDMKLVYEETEGNRSMENEKETESDKVETKSDKKETLDDIKGTTSEKKKAKSEVVETKKREHDKIETESDKKEPEKELSFFKQAKVTDASEAAVKVIPSPKAPRRVSFVTLSSPKNSKKKLNK